MTTKRNVRWHEDRQDRASERAERLGRMAMKLLDRAFDLHAEAKGLRGQARRSKSERTKAKFEKQAEALEARARAFQARSQRLGDQARAGRHASSRYGRAKTHIGIYNAEGRSGWSDRDRARKSRRPGSRDPGRSAYLVLRLRNGVRVVEAYAPTLKAAREWGAEAYATYAPKAKGDRILVAFNDPGVSINDSQIAFEVKSASPTAPLRYDQRTKGRSARDRSQLRARARSRR